MSFPQYNSVNVPVFTLEPNWTNGVSVVLRDKTKVFEALNLNEERHGFYPRPLIGLSYQALTLSGRELGYMRTAVEKRTDEMPWAMPVWVDQVWMTTGVSIGATTLPVTTTADQAWQYLPGWAIIYSRFDSWEVVSIGAVGSTSLTVSATTKAWPTNTRVIPLVFGQISRQSWKAITDENSQIPVKFSETFNGIAGQSTRETTSWTFATYAGRPVMDIRPTFDSLESGLLADGSQDSVGLGRVTVWHSTTGQKRTASFPFLLADKSEIKALRGFLSARYGRLEGFWMPLYQNDFPITADASAGATTITIERSNIGDRVSVGNQFKHICLLNGAKMEFYGIVSVSVATDTETITLDRGLDTALVAASTVCCGLAYVRASEDDITFDYVSDTCAQMTLKVNDLARETKGPAVTELWTELFFDDFNAENGGAPAANYGASLTNWNVTGSDIDLINSTTTPAPSNAAAQGLYIDLYGTTGTTDPFSRMERKVAYSYSPGDYRIRLKIAGHQTGYDKAVTISVGALASNTSTIPHLQIFTEKIVAFTVASTTSAKLAFESTLNDDNLGVLLDDIRIEKKSLINAGEVHLGVRNVTLYDFTRNGTHYRWCNYAVNLSIDGHTWTAGDITNRDLSVAMDFVSDAMALSVGTSDVDHPLRVYTDRRSIEVTNLKIYECAVDGSDFDADDSLVYDGRLGKVDFKEQGVMEISASSVLRIADRNLPMIRFQRRCNNIVFDDACGLVAASFTTTGTLSAVTDTYVEATAFGTAASGSGFANWFALGRVRVGNEIRFITAATGNRVYINAPFRDAIVSDACSATPGCDRLITTCHVRFANKVHFNGFPYIPNQNPQFKPLVAPEAQGGKKG